MDEDPNATPGKYSSEPASGLPFIVLALLAGGVAVLYLLVM